MNGEIISDTIQADDLHAKKYIKLCAKANTYDLERILQEDGLSTFIETVGESNYNSFIKFNTYFENDDIYRDFLGNVDVTKTFAAARTFSDEEINMINSEPILTGITLRLFSEIDIENNPELSNFEKMLEDARNFANYDDFSLENNSFIEHHLKELFGIYQEIDSDDGKIKLFESIRYLNMVPNTLFAVGFANAVKYVIDNGFETAKNAAEVLAYLRMPSIPYIVPTEFINFLGNDPSDEKTAYWKGILNELMLDEITKIIPVMQDSEYARIADGYKSARLLNLQDKFMRDLIAVLSGADKNQNHLYVQDSCRDYIEVYQNSSNLSHQQKDIFDQFEPLLSISQMKIFLSSDIDLIYQAYNSSQRHNADQFFFEKLPEALESGVVNQWAEHIVDGFTEDDDLIGGDKYRIGTLESREINL